MNFKAALFLIAKKVDITHMSINGWKKCYIHTMAYYSVIKRCEVLTHATTDEPWKHAAWKKPDTEGHTLHDSIHMKCQNVDILCHIHRDRK